ncbi:hypothetical protein [Gemmata sp.]|uniref:hypothetical protein n=1 Tax=Gemmata sp. TaxID=1914242 RepID=UPI003F72EF73
MSATGPERFKVFIPGKWMDELRALKAEARRDGWAPELLAAVKELGYRLTVEPDEWGESREYLPVLQLEVRFGVAGVVTVWYAVDVVARSVYVKRIGARNRPG